MTKVLDHAPSCSANSTRLADFIELECLKSRDGSTSLEDVQRALLRGSDTDVDSDDDGTEGIVQQAFAEIETRIEHTRSNPEAYPFELINRGNLVRIKSKDARSTPSRLLYVFLLFSTRLNMQNDREHAGIDATEVFEYLCREIAVRYWGGPIGVVNGVVFGTARTNDFLPRGDAIAIPGFAAAVNNLCEKLGEGNGFRAKVTSPIQAKDDSLDVVVWRDFADSLPGKLIGFAQCKTGTNWERGLTELDPRNWCDKWMENAPAVPPVRLYFIADRPPSDRWYNYSKDGGILFDRCRIIDLAVDLPRDLQIQWVRWTRAALKTNGRRLR